MTQIMLAMVYESSTGLYEHYSAAADADPYAKVAMHENERYQRESTLYVRFKQHEYQKIWERHGINLIDYINLPREYQEILRLAGEDVIKEREEASEQLKKEMEDARREDRAPPSVGPILNP